MSTPRVDLTGQKYGRLTVSAFAYRRNKQAVWRCVCECGRPHLATSNGLRAGSVRSCGCLVRPRMNLVGQRYGRLTVTELAQSKARDNVWRCLCDCGQTHLAATKSLRCGRVRSCGCLHAERVIDLAGQVFGRLTVLGKSDTVAFNRAAWMCQCQCGSLSRVLGTALRKGKSRSCGCLRNELSRERMRQMRRAA